jgi:iron(III) transport system ATP-binding protein
MTELRVEGLDKAFGNHQVLQQVDLTVPSGSLTAILGPSGSGKTTLLRLLCGFERADRGSIRIGGRTVSSASMHVPPERRAIGYVPQEGGLFPHLSVADNIAFGLSRRLRKIQYRVAELLELVGLPPSYANRPPQELSGGQQQRVALARALAPAPALILLDEPFSALDAALRIETRQAVARALEAAGATAVLVTHDQAEALSMGQQVAVLWRGQVAQVASPATLYRLPATPDLARFVGEAVTLDGIASQGRVTCALGVLQLAHGMPEGPVQVLLRPEQLRLTPLADASPAQQAVSTGARGKVLEVTYYGHDASVSLELLDEPSYPVLNARVPGHMSPRPGELLAVSVEGDVIAFAR